MAKVLGVKFKNTPKVYYFSPENDNAQYSEGQGVIVETAKGQEYASVVFGVKEIPDEQISHPLKPIARKADERADASIQDTAD